jgi:hypothetical protein
MLKVMKRFVVGPLLLAILAVGLAPSRGWSQQFEEITPASEAALELGLEWLAKNQGPKGNWDSEDLGLVSMGALAFMSAGNSPNRGKYGKECAKALEYVVQNSKPSGLLNISGAQRDMYNHGLATFVLGQAQGMTSGNDRQLNRTLDQAIKLIAYTQCEDGGWDYHARRMPAGHDLSLAVMQAKALRSAVDSGLEVQPEVIDLAIRSVREHYSPQGDRNAPESELRKRPGQFTYGKGGGGGTTAMAAAGVVCLQEFGQYDDWRIPKNMDVIAETIKKLPEPSKLPPGDGNMPFDSYTLYYVGQALYQVNDKYWEESYPKLRDMLVKSQRKDAKNPAVHGAWKDHGVRGGGHVGGKPGDLYATSVACFMLAIPNRYLPILQEGKIESLKSFTAR